MIKQQQRYCNHIRIPLVVVGVLCLIVAFTLRSMVRHGTLGCWPCADTVLTNSVDPGKACNALLVERDCGATTDFVRSIYITEGLAEGSYKQDNPIIITEGQGINSISWRDSSTLEVNYSKAQTKFFLKPKAWQQISIVYISNK